MNRKKNFVAGAFGLCCILGLAAGAPAQTDWEREWRRTVAEANKEGQLNFYGNHAYPPVLQEFRKKYPGIRVTEALGTASQLSQRILAERRAEKYLGDVYAASSRTAYAVLLPAKALDPIASALILPEVSDPSKWFQGKHHYVDSEQKYVFAMIGSVGGANIAYNTKLVNPREIKSYQDFLDPKWKGKIATVHPDVTGGNSNSGFTLFYYTPELGPTFIRRLFAEMDLALTRNEVQLLDWIAVGRFPIGFFVSEVDRAAEQGLPVSYFPPSGFKEGADIGPTGRGALALLNGGPHPNAAKLFVNWLLSREGQTTLQSVLRVWGLDSMREDISKEGVLPDARRVKGVKYLLSYRAEYTDVKDARAIANEALREAAKKKTNE
jgi:iron(III) transport system substrate-binding protein